MTDLSAQKRLAADELDVGQNKVWFDPERQSDLAEAITREDVRDLIDDATDRSLFDADAVSDLYADHMRGANNVSMIARVTTVEKWIQDHLE